MIVSALQGLVRAAALAARQSIGLSAQLDTEDRRVLEQLILPAYAQRADLQRVLFVGCAAYTQHYGEYFAGRDYWTIDPIPQRRRYGSRHHIVDELQNLGRHAAPGAFDLIICNGVLGWGLNTLADANLALAACYSHLRGGGEMLLGWNDVAPRNRVRPQDIDSMRGFERAHFDSVGSERWTSDAPNRHRFEFYRKL